MTNIWLQRIMQQPSRTHQMRLQTEQTEGRRITFYPLKEVTQNIHITLQILQTCRRKQRFSLSASHILFPLLLAHQRRKYVSAETEKTERSEVTSQ